MVSHSEPELANDLPDTLANAIADLDLEDYH